MHIPSFVSKLNLVDDWNDLTNDPSTSSLEVFVFKLIDHHKEKVLYIPSFNPDLVSFDEDFNSMIRELLEVIPLDYFDCSNYLFMKEWSFEAKLSFEKKLERCARVWGTSLSKLDPTSTGCSKTANLFSALDGMLLKVPLVDCLLSENMFVRQRRLYLENNLKNNTKKCL